MIKVDDTVQFKNGLYKGRTFFVGGVSDNGWDAETKTRRRMLFVTFEGFGRGCRMCVPEDLMEVTS